MEGREIDAAFGLGETAFVRIHAAVEMPEQPGSPFEKPDMKRIGVGEGDPEDPAGQAPEKTGHSPVRGGQHGSPAAAEIRKRNRRPEPADGLGIKRTTADEAAFVPTEKAVVQYHASDPGRVQLRPDAPEGGQAVFDAHIDENAAQIEQDGARNAAFVRKRRIWQAVSAGFER
jgi:hypothetical protein